MAEDLKPRYSLDYIQSCDTDAVMALAEEAFMRMLDTQPRLEKQIMRHMQDEDEKRAAYLQQNAQTMQAMFQAGYVTALKDLAGDRYE